MTSSSGSSSYLPPQRKDSTCAYLIRGEPRTSELQHQSSGPMLPAHIRSHPYHRPAVPDVDAASTSHYDHSEYYRYASTFHANYSENHLTHIMPAPQSVTPILPASSTSNGADIGLDLLGSSQEEQFATDFDLQPPSPLSDTTAEDLATLETAQSPILWYYFDHLREILLTFATDDLRDATHLMIERESRGALTSAVSALSNLHYTQKRVAQGLEAPDPNPEESNSAYLFNEALFQLNVARETNGYSESSCSSSRLLLPAIERYDELAATFSHPVRLARNSD
ncbi:hypothetical protein H0H92_007033 [Tricholoma furcatifolium]|nr:hypothetical protein H0H92_007033 [Tricholoma furcatifolium]